MELLEEGLKREVSLQRFSMVAIAVSAWEEAVIKDQVRNYFLTKKPTSQDRLYAKDEEWCGINNKMFHHLDSIRLPERVLSDIKDVAFFIGEKIFGWSEYVVNDLGLEFKYAEKIYWTNHGTINESKIFEMFWEKEKDLRSSKKSLNYLQNPVFTIACIFGRGKYINSNVNEVTEAVHKFCKSSKLPKKEKWEIYEIMAVGIYCFLKDDNSKYDRYSRLRDKELVLSPKQMLQLWSSAGFYSAVKYLINECKEISDSGVGATMHFAFRQSNNDETNFFKREKQAELFLFLLNYMTVKQKNFLFFWNNIMIASLLMENWSFQYTYLPVLFYMLDNSTQFDQTDLSDYVQTGSRSLTEYFLEDILPFLRDCLSKEVTSKFDVRKRAYFKIFKEVWKITPVCLKKKLFVDKTNFLLELYRHEHDYQTLSLIINDVELKEYKQNLIKLGEEIFSADVKIGKLERINRFIENVLINETDVEKQNFKNEFNFLFELAVKENFEVADKILDWLSESDEHKITLKRQINSVKICYIYIFDSGKFDVKVVDTLLTWQFGSDKILKKKVIDIIKYKDLVLSELSKVWGAKCSISVQSAKNSCLDVLRWFFKCYEINPFLKNEVVDDGGAFIQTFCNDLQSPDDFDTIEDLFEFCQTPSSVIKNLKKNIRSNITYWIDRYGIELRDFRVVNKVVNWCFLNDNEKKQAIQRYVNSEKGAKLCVEVFSYCTAQFPDPLVILCNSWVKQYGDILKIISNCEKLINKNDFTEKRKDFYIPIVIKLLSKLEKREFITTYDVRGFINRQYDDDGDEDDNFILDVDPRNEKEYDKLYSEIFN